MRLTAILLGVTCATGSAAQDPVAVADDRLDELVRASPFIPAGGAAPGEASSGELELRGVVWDGATLRFSIFDRGTGESVWTRLDEEGLPFRARSFDRESEVLTLEHQGRVLTLPLVEPEFSEIQPGETPAGSPPLPTNAPGGGIGGPPPQPGGLPAPASAPGTSAHDAQQLQQMADEARRRRGVGPPPTPPKN